MVATECGLGCQSIQGKPETLQKWILHFKIQEIQKMTVSKAMERRTESEKERKNKN